MDFKLSPIHSLSKIKNIREDDYHRTALSEIFNRPLLHSRVLERMKDSSFYRMYIEGHEMEVHSETALFKGEKLDLQVSRSGDDYKLEIMGRGISNKEDIQEDTTPWNRNSFSTFSILEKSLSHLGGEAELDKILKLLQTYLPGMEWKEKTPYFEWKFKDGEASGFYGNSGDSKCFYFQISSKILSAAEFFLKWNKPDLEELNITGYFEKQSAYAMGLVYLDEFVSSLESAGIKDPTISIFYSYRRFHQDHAEWSA